MRGCPRRRDKAGRENHGLDIFPQYPELFKFVGAGGFFCSGIQSLCIFLIFHEKIQEIRAWEKKDTDVLREGTENYRSETKIAQAVRPGQSQPIRPTVQPAMYAFSPMQSGAPGAAPQAMPGYAAQGGMTPPQAAPFAGMQPPPFARAQGVGSLSEYDASF